MSERKRGRAAMTDFDLVRAWTAKRYPFAKPDEPDYLARQFIRETEAEAAMRPLTIAEVIERWRHPEPVARALLAGALQPISDREKMLRFRWTHLLAVEPLYVDNVHPHPDHGRRRRYYSDPQREYRERITDYLREKNRLRRLEKTGGEVCIYFLEAVGANTCKIGKAEDIDKRFRALRTASAHPLHLVAADFGPASKERDYHREFAADRLHGEWFNLSEPLKVKIKELRRRNGLPGWAREMERSRISKAAAERRKLARATAAKNPHEERSTLDQ